jgi:uncharacterized coiled-coil DUF342 family protein
MKRLSKDQIARRDDLLNQLRETAEQIERAVDEANGAIQQYNTILVEVEIFRDDIISEMETYFDERSEKWQETDAATNYQDWKGQFEALETAELEQLEFTASLINELEALPDEPEA